MFSFKWTTFLKVCLLASSFSVFNTVSFWKVKVILHVTIQWQHGLFGTVVFIIGSFGFCEKFDCFKDLLEKVYIYS